MTVFADYVELPIGTLEICADNKGVTSIYFVQKRRAVNANQHTDLARVELIDYLNGERTEFSVPLNASGTDFQRRVWQALMDIPYGMTQSYQDIARAINNPKAVRAVGLANSKNPISIIVPCHRVIGKSGKLTGYASGLEKKAWLLKHEGVCG